MSHTKNSCKVNSSTKRGAGLAALVLACSLILCLTLSGCAKAVTPAGPWHNDELGQLLRFHDDGTVVIRTPYGDSEATWIFDKDGKQGVITLKGEAIGFVLDGDSLTLTLGDVQTIFVPGDMEIVPAVAQATPVSTPTPEAATSTPAPTATPAPTTTPEPSESSSPSLSFGAFPSLSFVPITPFATPTPGFSLNPNVSFHVIPGDVIGGLIGDSIVGDWYYTEDNTYVLTFDNSGGCIFAYGANGVQGTYTYNKIADTGVITLMDKDINFSISGDTLTWNDGSGFATFVRK